MHELSRQSVWYHCWTEYFPGAHICWILTVMSTAVKNKYTDRRGKGSTSPVSHLPVDMCLPSQQLSIQLQSFCLFLARMETVRSVRVVKSLLSFPQWENWSAFSFHRTTLHHTIPFTCAWKRPTTYCHIQPPNRCTICLWPQTVELTNYSREWLIYTTYETKGTIIPQNLKWLTHTAYETTRAHR